MIGRMAIQAAITEQAVPRAIFTRRKLIMAEAPECVFRGQYLTTLKCCGDVFRCSKHKRCTIGPNKQGFGSCGSCPDRTVIRNKPLPKLEFARPASPPPASESTPAKSPRSTNFPSGEVLIPKILHWVWIGPAPFPERDAKWVKSWIDRHPTWTPVLWTDAPDNLGPHVPGGLRVQLLPPLVNRKYYDTIEKWVTGRAAIAARSDIVRYELVARYGGLYLDTDVECFQPIDDLLRGVRLAVMDEWGPRPGNYAFCATPNHTAMWTAVRELGPRLDATNEKLNAVDATGPNYLGSKLRQHPDLVIFPYMLFNPLCAFDSPEQVQRWPAVSVANHHFDGKWYDRTKRKPPAEFR